MALALWGLEGWSLPQVRQRVALGAQVGFTAAAEWITLRRWARHFARAGQTLRDAAAQVAQRAVSFAPKQASLGSMAFEGALLATF
jgi:hypothetical protein